MQLIISSTKRLHIQEHIFKNYVDYLEFKYNFHNILNSPHISTYKMEGEIHFCITERDIMVGVVEWSIHYETPLSEVQDEFDIRKNKSQQQNRTMTIFDPM
jgi:hypothetical protein